jgi:hypothetical protein
MWGMYHTFHDRNNNFGQSKDVSSYLTHVTLKFDPIQEIIQNR